MVKTTPVKANGIKKIGQKFQFHSVINPNEMD
jgi:hypothetical protein